MNNGGMGAMNSGGGFGAMDNAFGGGNNMQ